MSRIRIATHWTPAQMNRIPRGTLARFDEHDLETILPDDLIVMATHQTAVALRYKCPRCTVRHRHNGAHDRRFRPVEHEHGRAADGRVHAEPSHCPYVSGAVWVVPIA